MIKKTILSFVLATYLSQSALFAQESIQPITYAAEPSSQQEVQPASNKPKKDSNLQNWLFAAGSIVCATIAIVIVALNPGSSVSQTSQ